MKAQPDVSWTCTSQVTVTGAGGRTGKLILQKLLAQPDRFTARGLVRDEQGVKKLESQGVSAQQLFAGDIAEDTAALEKSLQGADALIIATSGVPQMKPPSQIGVRQHFPSVFNLRQFLYMPMSAV